MGHPTRTAFCPVLFGANGGRFDENGLPIFQRKRELVVRGRCSDAYDCGTCPHLTAWLGYQTGAGWQVSWECVECIKQTDRPDEEIGLERRTPGFYQEGTNETASKGLPGCMRCGWESLFLQLVLRR